MARNNGRRGRITFSIVVPAMLMPTNNKVPAGGEQIPMHRFITMMIPKCTGSTPNTVTTGRKIGVKMSAAGCYQPGSASGLSLFTG